MNTEINITPMSLKNGVLGLSTKCAKGWTAADSFGSVSKEGVFEYAGRKSNITISPKHVNYDTKTAAAWQFTVNDSVQFAQLKLDGVHTYVEEKLQGEKLLCEVDEVNGQVRIKVVDTKLNPPTAATEKVKALLKQGIRPEEQGRGGAPKWNAPSAWIPFGEINDYRDVTDCMYMWQGRNALDEEDTAVYLYVGIVGDTRSAGASKRNLTQRLLEEEKKYLAENHVAIQQFRYCSLNSCENIDIPVLLKTVEMSVITTMTSLYPCENARDNIDALFPRQGVVLLNKMTSYKYVQ